MSREILILFLSSLLNKIRLYFPLRSKKNIYLVNFFLLLLFSAIFRISLSSWFSFTLSNTYYSLLEFVLACEFQCVPSIGKAPKTPFSVSFPMARLGFLLVALHCLALSFFTRCLFTTYKQIFRASTVC